MSRTRNLKSSGSYDGKKIIFSSPAERNAYNYLNEVANQTSLTVEVSAASTIQPGSPLVSTGVTDGVMSVAEPTANEVGQIIVGIYNGAIPASGTISMLIQGTCDVKVTGTVVPGKRITANIASGSTDEFKVSTVATGGMMVLGDAEYMSGADYYNVRLFKPFPAIA